MVTLVYACLFLKRF